MARRLEISLFALLSLIGILTTSGCGLQKVSVTPPTVTVQTKTYVVVQNSPDNFTVLTRSKAAMDEIARQLGCDRPHICSSEWNGEVWTIQRLK